MCRRVLSGIMGVRRSRSTVANVSMQVLTSSSVICRSPSLTDCRRHFADWLEELYVDVKDLIVCMFPSPYRGSDAEGREADFGLDQQEANCLYEDTFHACMVGEYLPSAHLPASTERSYRSLRRAGDDGFGRFGPAHEIYRAFTIRNASRRILDRREPIPILHGVVPLCLS